MALNANTGELMAVKQVEIQGDHKSVHRDAPKFLAFENKTLKELDHPNIVQYLGCEASLETLSLYVDLIFMMLLILTFLTVSWSMFLEEQSQHYSTSTADFVKKSRNPLRSKFLMALNTFIHVKSFTG